MRLGDGGSCHLSYCSNIHPGEDWPETFASLQKYLPAVKARVSPERPFGVGLRLSAAAAAGLAEGNNIETFKEFLDDEGLYVFTINGFPYGVFHGEPVKENVYQPDWRQQARLDYSNLLADLFARFLPNGIDGSISTVPGAFKPEVSDNDDVEAMAGMMIRHAAHLVELRRDSGKLIALALEPEPYCFIETIAEAIDFFTGHLFSDAAAGQLAELTGLDQAAAATALRDHLGLCLDLCHAAVEFEDADECLAQLEAAGIPLHKVQISAGLKISPVTDEAARRLAPFDDQVYLHQVVARQNGELKRYPDLAPAFADRDSGITADEWRVHFHVPIFHADLGSFATTRDFIEAILARHVKTPLSPHLEVETYTFDVLPEEFRSTDVVENVVKELTWCLQQLKV